MTRAERIREMYRDNPHLTYADVAKELKTNESNIRAQLSKDVTAGRALKIEGGGYDYTPYFEKDTILADFIDWKNETKRHMVDMLMRAAERETDSNIMRLLIKEANKIMKEITK